MGTAFGLDGSMSLVTLESLPADKPLSTDICIVGAGPAGITLALTLDKAGISTVLLESGGLEAEAATQALYNTVSTGLPYSGSDTRRRQFGGSSNCWSGWCRPLDPADFKPHDTIPLSGWPIPYAEYAQHLPEAHSLCELGKVDYSLEYWQSRLPPPWNKHPHVSSPSIHSGVWQHSPPTRFGRKYRSMLERSTNCTVILHANAVSSHVEGRRVTEIEARSLGMKRLRIKANYFILACGGIENPRLLLTLNGHGRPALGNEYGLVGRYFTDHLIFHDLLTLYPLTPHLHLYVDQLPLGTSPPQALTPWLGLSRPLQAQHGVSNTTLRLQRATQLRETDSAGAAVWNALSRLHGASGASFPHRKRMAAVMISDIIPNRESRISLDHLKDALGMPRARINWRIKAEDLASMRRSAELLAHETLRLGIARGSPAHVPALSDMDNSAYWIGYHHYGTTRMATDPRHGVVDTNCRLHSLENLYVAGSSIFPTPGASTPTLSVVALALRLGKHLKQRLAT